MISNVECFDKCSIEKRQIEMLCSAWHSFLQPVVLHIWVLCYHSDIVRKKAVMAAMWFNQLDPTSISSTKSKFQKTLCDGSAAVMGATLNAYLELVEVR